MKTYASEKMGKDENVLKPTKYGHYLTEEGEAISFCFQHSVYPNVYYTVEGGCSRGSRRWRLRDFYFDPRMIPVTVTSGYSRGNSGMSPWRFGVTTQTILFGGDEPAAVDSAEVTRPIRVTETKAISEVLWYGQPAGQVSDESYRAKG